MVLAGLAYTQWRNSYTCFLVAAFMPRIEYSNAVLTVSSCVLLGAALVLGCSMSLSVRGSVNRLFLVLFSLQECFLGHSQIIQVLQEEESQVYILCLIEEHMHGKCCHRLFQNDGAGASVLMLILTVDVEVTHE